MNHLDSELEDDEAELGMEEFRFHELLQRPVIRPFIFVELIFEIPKLIECQRSFIRFWLSL